jgi:enoyl-CoA hydratase/carnithine racemase
MAFQFMFRRFYCAQSLPKTIKLVEKGSCGIVQLDRPEELNAINGDMFK